MPIKHIEKLTNDEINKLISSKVLHKEWDPCKDYCGSWYHGGPIIEKYLIGSEGKSAWVWHHSRNYGIVGNSQLDACMKALLLSRYPSGTVWVEG